MNTLKYNGKFLYFITFPFHMYLSAHRSLDSMYAISGVKTVISSYRPLYQATRFMYS